MTSSKSKSPYKKKLLKNIKNSKNPHHNPLTFSIKVDSIKYPKSTELPVFKNYPKIILSINPKVYTITLLPKKNLHFRTIIPLKNSQEEPAH